MSKTRKPTTLSDQLREIILNGPKTRYRISKEAGVDASQLHRFVNRQGRLTTDTLDKIGVVLKLRLEIEE